MLNDKHTGVHIALKAELYASLQHYAKRNGEPTVALIRRILSQHFDKTGEHTDRLTLQVRAAVRGAVAPVESALATRAANTVIAAAKGMYLGVQAAADLGAKDTVSLHRQAETEALRDELDDEKDK